MQERLKSQLGLKSQKILVVDDIEINRSIFARQLEAEGAIAVEAASGPSAPSRRSSRPKRRASRSTWC